jgi:quercetin 2,3-dioxygenase
MSYPRFSGPHGNNHDMPAQRNIFGKWTPTVHDVKRGKRAILYYKTMIEIRHRNERGHFDYGWLNTFHTFSFDRYYDPHYMGFRTLRVINEDRVAPAKGFGTHPHRDMEILTYILEGKLEHKDSMGTGSIIRPGEVQRMSAGTGVTHSEFNPSKTEPVHLLQIWILPETRGLEPSYEQKQFEGEELRGKVRLIAARDPVDDAVKIHQDVRLFATRLERDTVRHHLDPRRFAWVQVARGEMQLNGLHLEAGDGAALGQEQSLELTGTGEALIFDLA